MPEGFDAGSIFVALRAQLDDFNKGIASAKTTLDSLGAASAQTVVEFTELDTSVQVFKEIETRASRVRTAIASLGTESSRTATAIRSQTEATRANVQATDQAEQTVAKANVTWARAANRIISVQIALLTLAQHGSGPVKEAFQAISSGVSVAAASMQLFHGKISNLGAGLIGVGVAAVSLFTRYLEDAIKATDSATEAEEKMRQNTERLSLAIKDAKYSIDVFGGTASDKLVASLRLTESAFAANLKRIREIGDEITKLKGQTAIFDPDQSAKIGKLEQERLNLNRQNSDIRNTGVFDKANSDVSKLLQSTRELNTEIGDVGIKGKAALDFGIAQPAEIASRNLQASRAYFDKLLDDNVKITEESLKYNLSLEDQARIIKNLHPLSELDKAKQDFLDKKSIDERTRAVNDLAGTFSTSVGDGLRDAILNAQRPMEALAAVGKNLFGNMIDQSVKRLETGLTEAFKAISGAAGEGIGLAVTGILGAAGAVLSKLGSKGSDSYGNVQSAVTSTQAVRGIVAGPSSVAIATVGDDLSRAVAPVVNGIGLMITALGKIEANTRSGGRGGGLSSNVGFATP